MLEGACPRRTRRSLAAILCLAALALASGAAGQTHSDALLAEIGAGMAMVGGGSSGPVVRIAARYTGPTWGIAARLISHSGPQGEEISGLFGSFQYHESYDDRGLLVTRRLARHVVAGLGVGRFHGNRLTEDGRELEEVGPVVSFPFEIGAYTRESFANGGLVLHGTANREAVQLGLTLNFALGRWP
jgi:hypothetical protein